MDAVIDVRGMVKRYSGRAVVDHVSIKVAEGEISGHYHPKASVTVRNRRVGGRCFVTDGKRLILPAFGAYAGGLDVHNPAIERLLDPEYAVFILGKARVYGFRRKRLLPQTVTEAAAEQPRLL